MHSICTSAYLAKKNLLVTEIVLNWKKMYVVINGETLMLKITVSKWQRLALGVFWKAHLHYCLIRTLLPKNI